MLNPQVVAHFAEEDMDVEALSAFPEADLEAMGVAKRGQRIKLIK